MPTHRYQLLADELGISVIQLEKDINVPTTTLGSAIRRGSKISADIINKIVERYPQVSKDWLLTGVEPMFIEPVSNELSELNTGYTRIQLFDDSSLSEIARKALLKEYRDKTNEMPVYAIFADMAMQINELRTELEMLKGRL